MRSHERVGLFTQVILDIELRKFLDWKTGSLAFFLRHVCFYI